ncbi:MAG: hypothetical protein Q8O42_18435 [Acidobacteriota bacterium]|nr:hypothetical protein [Acidobacteriota bacterium]
MKIMMAVAAMLSVLVQADSAMAQTPEQRIDTAMARARDAGIPVTLLNSKMAEGKAKGVSMDRIAAAIEKRGAALERAREALRGRPEVGSADLAVGADAVEAGVSDAVLRTIADTAPRDRRVVAIAALTELVRLGHVPEAALDRVRAALKRGPDALANLPAEAGAAGGRRTGPPDTPGASGGRGGTQAGPPASVPAPGKGTQPTKPGGPPSTTPGKPTTPKPPGRGGPGGN